MIQYNIESDWHGRFRIGAYRVTRQSEHQSTSMFLHYLKGIDGQAKTFDTEVEAQKFIETPGIIKHIFGDDDEAKSS